MAKLARVCCNEHEIVTIFDWWLINTFYKLLSWVFEMASLMMMMMMMMMWWWAWALAKTSILLSLNTKASVTMCDSHIRCTDSHNLSTMWSTNIVIDCFLSVCGTVVLLVAQQLCYLCCVCAVCSEMYLPLNLYFTWIRMLCMWTVWITSVTDVENLYSPRRKSGQWSTQIYHRLLIHCLSVKVCLFQNHPRFSLDRDEEGEMFLKKH